MDRPPRPPDPAPPHLTDAQRDAVAALLAAAVLGASPQVGQQAERARALGVASDVVREALLLVVPYAGFPRALSAFGAARAALVPPPGATHDVPLEARPGAGRAAFDAVYGPTSARVLEGLGALDPRLPAWTLEFAYGRVIARSGLSLRDRELLAVAMLTALGGLADPLLGHLRGALRLGASEAALAGVLEAVAPVAGAPRVAEARAVLARR